MKDGVRSLAMTMAILAPKFQMKAAAPMGQTHAISPEFGTIPPTPAVEHNFSLQNLPDSLLPHRESKVTRHTHGGKASSWLQTPHRSSPKSLTQSSAPTFCTEHRVSGANEPHAHRPGACAAGGGREASHRSMQGLPQST